MKPRLARSSPVLTGLLGAAAALVVSTLSPAAQANGRFPAANQFVFHPNQPDSLIVRATFGILRSEDGARRVSLICDQIIGAATSVDPGVGLTSDGSILIASPDGLGVSRDNGCTFGFVGGELDKQKFVDLSVDRQNPSRAVAVTATALPAGGEYVRVFETVNDGRDWRAVGQPQEPNQLVTTIDIAPSRGSRLYMSGMNVIGQKLEGFVAASDDGGETWERHRLPATKVQQLYIAGVDPVNPDVLYVRSYFSESGPSTLFVSTDGARTFVPAVTIDASMQGFALSADGGRVAIGSFLGTMVAARPFPVAPDASVPADASTAGDGASAWQFEQRSTDPAVCLAWRGDGTLFSCGRGIPRGCGTGDGKFLLASSTDEARTWNTLIPLLADVQEPSRACAPNTPSAQVCTPDWPRQHRVLQCAFTANAVDGGADAGSGGGDGGPQPTTPADDGCGCSVPGSTGARWLGVALGLIAAGAAVARRHQRRNGVPPQTGRP